MSHSSPKLGLYLLLSLSGLFASGCSSDGDCTVVSGEDGTASITCPDGTTAEIGSTPGSESDELDEGGGADNNEEGDLGDEETLPPLPLVTLITDDPLTECTVLLCEAEYPSTTEGGLSLTPSFEWTRNGVPFTATTTTNFPGDTIPNTELTGGDTFECTVSVSDGQLTSPSNSSSLTTELYAEEGTGFPMSDQMIDILLVVDNSGSMSEEQSLLASSASSLLSGLNQDGWDFHIGVITTDTDTASAAGVLLSTGGLSWVENTTPDLQDTYSEVILSAGTNGSATERGLRAIDRFLDKRDSQNAGFYREEAAFHVVVISDEDDYSVNDPTVPSMVSSLTSLKASTDRVVVTSIVGPNPLGCNGTNGVAEPGARYLSVSNQLGGSSTSICTTDASDWVSAVEQDRDALPFVSGIVLPQAGSSAAPSIQVFDAFGNATSLTEGADYTYDASSSTVSLLDESYQDWDYRIEYLLECP